MDSTECRNEDHRNAEETEPKAGALHQTLKMVGFTLLGAAVAVPAICLYLGKRALVHERSARQRRSLSPGVSGEMTKEEPQSVRITLVSDAPRAQVEATPEIPKASAPRYVASTERDKYHVPDCRRAHQIREEHRLTFADREEAVQRGYSPCGTCNP
jgi:hypothetical protein